MNFDQLVQHARHHSRMFPSERRTEWASGQQPLALFITCSDSRVIPAQITGAEPGKLFELRTPGNVVPQYAPDSGSSEMATIEYAVLRLGVPDIVVCGHSHCGVVTALAVAGQGLEQMPAMRTWLGTDGLPAHHEGAPDPGVRTETKQHLRTQLSTLSQYPFVQERIEDGRLRLHGWFYEIDTGLLFVCPPESSSEDFLPL